MRSSEFGEGIGKSGKCPTIARISHGAAVETADT